MPLSAGKGALPAALNPCVCLIKDHFVVFLKIKYTLYSFAYEDVSVATISSRLISLLSVNSPI